MRALLYCQGYSVIMFYPNGQLQRHYCYYKHILSSLMAWKHLLIGKMYTAEQVHKNKNVYHTCRGQERERHRDKVSEREQQVVAAAGLLLTSFLPLLPPQSIHFCSIRRMTAVNRTVCSPLSHSALPYISYFIWNETLPWFNYQIMHIDDEILTPACEPMTCLMSH